MPPERPPSLALIGTAAALLCWALLVPAAAEVPVKRGERSILVVYSNGRLLPANAEFDRGLRQSLAKSPEGAVEIYDEFMDVPRFQSAEHLETFRTYLREKYARRPPAVLVAAGEEAARFVLAHRDDLFSGTPRVYGAIGPGDEKELPPLPPDMIGAPLELSFVRTIEQALLWHPGTRRLVIVTGAAPWDRSVESRLRQEAAVFDGRLEIEFLSGLPAEELVDRVSHLERGTILFAPGFFQDGAGRTYVPRESVELVTHSANAPVYCSYTPLLGTGTVGGYLASFGEAGAEAGREVAQLLAGTPPFAVQRMAIVPATLEVDWREIRRWRIDPRKIPAEAGIRFREVSIFDAYRTQVLIATAVLAVQATLIVLLLFERRRRRAAEAAEQERRLELAHASRLATAGELMGSIAHEISQPLGAILANAEAAELMLAAEGETRSELGEILADIRRDDLRASAVIRKLRAFLARQAVEKQPFHVVDAVREVESLVRREARRRRIAFDLRLPSTPAQVLGDRTQFQQILLNLLLNAMDAVADQPEDRRTIVISLQERLRGEEIEIAVEDRGHGIAPENLQRLFDSFFTTKRQGMGLGLSIARSLVEAHGGRIAATSEPGRGTTFRVHLPTDYGHPPPAKDVS